MDEEKPNVEGEGLIRSILRSTPGYEAKIFKRYAERLSRFAGSRMPGKIKGRVDSEDIVQSVFRSFFRRQKEGEFSFDDSLDLWNLLVALTYRKVLNQVRFHTRDKRDVNKEGDEGNVSAESGPYDLMPGPEQVNIMVDYLGWILNRLPDESRPIITQRIEGYSIEEIAEHQQVSQRTVKRVLSRAREIVKQQIENEIAD